MNLYYSVIDTNILVSSLLKPDSLPGFILKEVIQGRIVPIFNEEIIEEYETVLRRDKFEFTEKVIDSIIDIFILRGISVHRLPQTIDLIDEKDRCFYEVL